MSVAERKVVIVQRRLTDYRVPLFEQMRERLRMNGIELKLLVGDATIEESRKHDEGKLDWAVYVSSKYFFGGRICWQNFEKEAVGADLVIITQENKLLFNLFALTFLRPSRIAFWGHGRNMQAKSNNSLLERFKRWTTCQVDWWFAYNELSASYIRDAGFSHGKITTLDNAIDTSALRVDLNSITQENILAFRQHHRLNVGLTGLFIGSLYTEKRIDFLINAALQISERLPGFVLLIAGDGPDRSLVESARNENCIRYLGSVRGKDKALLLRVADAMLNPGLVGLGLLDAFSAGLPLITTDCRLHSPEIDYLVSGVNGLMTDNTTPAFVGACLDVFQNAHIADELSKGALASGSRYTIENMVHLYCAGILRCLVEVRT